MISFRDAFDLLLKNTVRIPSERCRIEQAPGRVLREAIVFSVSAQTGPIMEATLSRLTRL